MEHVKTEMIGRLRFSFFRSNCRRTFRKIKVKRSKLAISYKSQDRNMFNTKSLTGSSPKRVKSSVIKRDSPCAIKKKPNTSRA